MYRISIKLYLIIGLIIPLKLFGQPQQLINSKYLKPEKTTSSKEIYLDIYLHGLTSVDTITGSYWKTVLSDENNINQFLPHNEITIMKNKRGYFHCDVRGLTGPAYLSVSLIRNKVFGMPVFFINKYLMEPGDSIRMDIAINPDYSDTMPHLFKDELNLRYNTIFSGKGSAKYECRFLADRKAALSTINTLFDYKNDFNMVNHWDKGLAVSLNILDSFGSKITPFSYQVMKADFLGRYEYEKYKDFRYEWFAAIDKGDSSLLRKLITLFNVRLLKNNAASAERYAKAFSNNYPSYVLERIRDINSVLDKLTEEKLYYKLKREYTGELRDKLLTIYLLSRFNFANNLQRELDDALQTIKTNFCLQQLKKLNNAQSRRVQAYNFSLPDTSGRMVSLKDLNDKVVFMDFWYTGCIHCADYYQNQIAKVENEFAANPGVVFLSVSIDRMRGMWIKSIHSGKYTTASSRNVINLYTAGHGDNHPIIKHYNISGFPTPILIGKNGKIFCTNQLVLRTKNGLSGQIRNALNKK